MSANTSIDSVVGHVLEQGFADLGRSLQDALDPTVGCDARQRELLSKFAEVLIKAGKEVDPYGGVDMMAPYNELLQQMQVREEEVADEVAVGTEDVVDVGEGEEKGEG